MCCLIEILEVDDNNDSLNHAENNCHLFFRFLFFSLNNPILQILCLNSKLCWKFLPLLPLFLIIYTTFAMNQCLGVIRLTIKVIQIFKFSGGCP